MWDAILKVALRASVGPSSDVAQNDDIVIGSDQLYLLGFFVVVKIVIAHFSTSSNGRQQHRQRSGIRTRCWHVLRNWVCPKVL